MSDEPEDPKRYVPNGTPLSAREREIITHLAEEALEVAHAAMKLLRFGKEDTNPSTGASNSYVLGLEVGNLWTMVDLAAQSPLIIEADVTEGRSQKFERLKIYSRYLP